MADQTTPVTAKVQSKVGHEMLSSTGEPIPKSDIRPLVNPKHVFMSPTDAITSPCTQKLINLHRLPIRNARASNTAGHPVSKLANKENELSCTKQDINKEVVTSSTTQ